MRTQIKHIKSAIFTAWFAFMKRLFLWKHLVCTSKTQLNTRNLIYSATIRIEWQGMEVTIGKGQENEKKENNFRKSKGNENKREWKWKEIKGKKEHWNERKTRKMKTRKKVGK